nr:MAG TPA: hypothetical protein [Caudoviricetes sp.]
MLNTIRTTTKTELKNIFYNKNKKVGILFKIPKLDSTSYRGHSH